ncbi:DUF4142 domain-containing protein [Sinorhizobium terangae]|uniref:DUF4142 domain-containing protein n=1 Tax=Sinorhizobium terangae TaxID=110322 RepID=A0A6N7LL51_SINTE|nr:DUF4142 domain-containing protein [Sinorhizobium terangae]MBB4184802.1 putative membrane protein [Sinorhizobium terangae]MQX17474.1 DUF4142 domain-containing protein [Sinorhizobium terangae]WFU50752.1 DUF4142 domain-containing protein [Sinorhizobium terangae]
MSRFAGCYLATALLAVPAAAQIGNPAGLDADTRMAKPGVPALHQTNNQDRLFARLAAAGGMAEVELGKLAAGKTETEAVKEFANRMVTDHGTANDRLKQLAEASKMPLPEKLDAEHAAIRKRLQSLNGKAFDLAYIKAQIVDHQKASHLLQWEISSGEDAELQRYAAEILPRVLLHLEMARNIHDELAGVVTQ